MKVDVQGEIRLKCYMPSCVGKGGRAWGARDSEAVPRGDPILSLSPQRCESG